MKSKAFTLAALAGIFSGGNTQSFPGYKRKPRRLTSNKVDERNKSYVPPRSMTPAEREYYAVHKNLHHFREAQS